MARPTKNARMTRRQYLLYRALEKGISPATAERGVDDTLRDHPEWNTSEKKSWDDWKYFTERGW